MKLNTFNIDKLKNNVQFKFGIEGLLAQWPYYIFCATCFKPYLLESMKVIDIKLKHHYNEYGYVKGKFGLGKDVICQAFIGQTLEERVKQIFFERQNI